MLFCASPTVRRRHALRLFVDLCSTGEWPVIWDNVLQFWAPTACAVFASNYWAQAIKIAKARCDESRRWWRFLAAVVVDELVQELQDVKFDEHCINGFWDTPLDSNLRNLGIKTALFVGVNTDQCVLHSLTDANFLGYRCILIEDCCATSSPDFCREATIWNVNRCFDFVTESAAILAALELQASAHAAAAVCEESAAST